MSELADLEDSLIAVRQAFTDVVMVLDWRAALLTRAQRLEPLLLGELHALIPRIEQAIAALATHQEESSR